MRIIVTTIEPTDEVESQQLVSWHIRPVVLPPVGGGNGRIEGLVGVIEPGRARVVEGGEGPFLQLRDMPRLGDEAIWIARDQLRDPLHPFRGVQPVFA